MNSTTAAATASGSWSAIALAAGRATSSRYGLFGYRRHLVSASVGYEFSQARLIEDVTNGDRGLAVAQLLHRGGVRQHIEGLFERIEVFRG